LFLGHHPGEFIGQQAECRFGVGKETEIDRKVLADLIWIQVDVDNRHPWREHT
jgi:hypothetical protein